MQNLKVGLIGATGKAGAYILNSFLTQNYTVKALVRNPQKLKVNHSALEVIPGNVNDADSINTLIKTCDVVVSALGLGEPASEGTIFTHSTRNVLKAMETFGLKRYIVITGINVDAVSDKKDSKTKFATQWMYKNYPVSTADKQQEYEILAKSNVDWTLIRLPMIIQTDQLSATTASLVNCDGDQISAANLGRFIIDLVSSHTYLKQAPFIWNA